MNAIAVKLSPLYLHFDIWLRPSLDLVVAEVGARSSLATEQHRDEHEEDEDQSSEDAGLTALLEKVPGERPALRNGQVEESEDNLQKEKELHRVHAEPVKVITFTSSHVFRPSLSLG